MDQLHLKLASKGRIPPGAVCAGENVNDEKLYIGRWTAYNPAVPLHRMDLFIPGIITPSQDSFTFCNYNAIEKALPLATITVEEVKFHVLTSICRAPDFLYWEPSEKFTLNRSLPRNVVMMDTVVRSHVPCLLFVAQVPPTVIHDGKVIGHYDKALFPADFSGPLVGAGQAWLDLNCHETELAMDYLDYRYNSYNVNVFYDGKIYEASSFFFLCVHTIPDLYHYTFSEIKWEPVCDGQLPPNALPAGIAPTREVLYVGRIKHYDKIPGYIVPSKNCLHICWNCEEHRYTSGYKVLTMEESDAFEWCTYSGGEVPSTAISCGSGDDDDEELYIGRTVTNSDVTVGVTWEGIGINLPLERAANTQLIGKIHCSHGCLYVPWDGKEYIYQTYEVLVRKFRPKNLQELCRNVIITATLAIPDRVDKLSLPTHLKEYCKVNSY